jgi:GH15 family glucan-1,4-alpha-glucosidase
MFWITQKSLPFFNRFKFKKLRTMPSRDGVAYTCDLWFDNQKIAHVENDGRGGMTMIDYVDGGKDFIKSLDVPQYYNKDEINFRINTEYIISDLVEVKIFLQDMLKKQSRNIFFLDKNDNIMKVTYRYSLNKIKASGQLPLVKKRVDKIKEDGGLILNTNLARLGL